MRARAAVLPASSKKTCHITLTLTTLEALPEERRRRRILPGKADDRADLGGEARRAHRGARRRGLRRKTGRPRSSRKSARRSPSDPAGRRRRTDGPEDSSRRATRRRHPRLEVELVREPQGLRADADRGREDPRAHHEEALPRGPVGHPHPQGQPARHDRHLHGAPGHRHRQVRCRGRRAAPRDPRDDAEERPHQHQRDQAARAGRQARRAVDRGAAREPRELPPRDEALARVRHPLRRARREDHVRRPARRLRDEPLRDLLGGPRPAAHDPRRHRLRPDRGQDDHRPHRREGLDQQGRDHARGLRDDLRPRRAARRPGSRRAAGAASARGSPPPARAAAGAARTAKASARCASANRADAGRAAAAAAGRGPGRPGGGRGGRPRSQETRRAPTERRDAGGRRERRRSRRRRRDPPAPVAEAPDTTPTQPVEAPAGRQAAERRRAGRREHRSRAAGRRASS